jgi:hypothetical protein
MANRQHPAEFIGRDTVNGAAERIPPGYMVRSALLCGFLSLEYDRYERRLTRSPSPIWMVTMAPLAKPQTNVIGNVESH